MKIISHRGDWTHPQEKNTVTAFTRSFDKHFGTETDIRDVHRQLVISHDMGGNDSLPVDDLLTLLARRPLPLALNIKSDGLADALLDSTRQYPELEYFVFDMSVPDMRLYLERGMPVYGRMSEVEREVPWMDACKGIWLDAFESMWYTDELLMALLATGKEVCVVSRELHNDSYPLQWQLLKKIPYCTNLMICTDIPEIALEYFGGNND